MQTSSGLFTGRKILSTAILSTGFRPFRFFTETMRALNWAHMQMLIVGMLNNVLTSKQQIRWGFGKKVYQNVLTNVATSWNNDQCRISVGPFWCVSFCCSPLSVPPTALNHIQSKKRPSKTEAHSIYETKMEIYEVIHFCFALFLSSSYFYLNGPSKEVIAALWNFFSLLWFHNNTVFVRGITALTVMLSAHIFMVFNLSDTIPWTARLLHSSTPVV